MTSFDIPEFRAHCSRLTLNFCAKYSITYLARKIQSQNTFIKLAYNLYLFC